MFTLAIIAIVLSGIAIISTGLLTILVVYEVIELPKQVTKSSADLSAAIKVLGNWKAEVGNPLEQRLFNAYNETDNNLLDVRDKQTELEAKLDKLTIQLKPTPENKPLIEASKARLDNIDNEDY